MVPPYYLVGSRTAQAIHCKLRLNMSDLQNDLFNRFLTDDKTCECGFTEENAHHYLLNCPRFNAVRATTIDILPPLAISIDTLLFGNTNLSLPLTTTYLAEIPLALIKNQERGFKNLAYWL